MKKNKKQKRAKKLSDRTRNTRSAAAHARADAARPGYAVNARHVPAGMTSKRLYTTEEIAAKYGITVDEMTAIAGKLGLIGDPRYGEWVLSEIPPREPDERLPLSTNVGPIAHANLEHMLRQVDDQMPELIAKSIEAGSDFTIMVYDPTKPMMGEILSDEVRDLFADAKGKPLAALLPTETVLRLLQHFEQLPGLLRMLERLKAPRDGNRVPIVLMYGATLGFHDSVPGHDDFAMIPSVDFEQVPGIDGYVLTVTGAIKTICSADPEDLAPGWTAERCRLARARAIASITAERMKPNPRAVNDVLVDTFGGDRLRRALKAEGTEGLVRVIDSVLRATN
jgi:hypothetical protein